MIVILLAIILLEVLIKPVIFISLLCCNLPVILQRSPSGKPLILEAYNVLLVNWFEEYIFCLVVILQLISIILLFSNIPIILQRSWPTFRILEVYKLLAVISIPVILLLVFISPSISILLLLDKNPRILPR